MTQHSYEDFGMDVKGMDNVYFALLSSTALSNLIPIAALTKSL